MSADYLKRPGTVAQGERPQTTATHTRQTSLDELLKGELGDDASSSKEASRPSSTRKASLTIEEQLAMEVAGTDKATLSKATPSPLKASLSSQTQSVGGNSFPSRKIRTSQGSFG